MIEIDPIGQSVDWATLNEGERHALWLVDQDFGGTLSYVEFCDVMDFLLGLDR